LKNYGVASSQKLPPGSTNFGYRSYIEKHVSAAELALDDVVDVLFFARSAGATGPGRVGVLTSSSVVVLDSEGTQRGASAPDDARLLRSADVNGDGLGDLLLVTESGVEVLLATPAAPLGNERQ